ncbi:hypothetical protein E0Z10_g2221 [Xylaria hypoxylon]|uniref:Uncharacterized protein n=1 Tax=Xylaria hypoxylon TaxID=37992 RepID=A0A4Z0Z4A6_9PEZI|nr:hypothetical protein E0Z10_g2221 [Xylaria hypoxylon]
MADRAPLPSLRAGAHRITRAATTTAAVRRNLFQSQLTRRPTPTETTRPGAGDIANTSMTTSSSTNSAETLRLDVDVLSESSEIVIRDKNGEFEIEDPPTPPLDDPDDEVALDDAQENERERQKLAEAVRHHQVNHTRMPAQPEEVLEILKASMRAKVAALSEDNWMYEAEEPPRVH